MVAAMAAFAGRARAQDTVTTHIPSPYVSFEQRHGFTFLAGYFAGNTGDAGVGPQGSLDVGIMYHRHLSGPVFAAARFQYAPSQRTVLDPALPKDQQNTGTVSSPLYMFDLALHLAVTGEKTWHGMIPTVGFALGAAYNPQKPDIGGYAFGTQFLFGFGGGVAYHIKGHWVGRADVWDFLWQLHYPTTYFTTGPNSVLPVNAPDKQWTNNAILTVGLTYSIAH
jgi:hypothetical protein